jgi:hypothetical protein
MARTKKLVSAATQLSEGIKDVVIAQPRVLSVALEIAGTAELIQNNFSQKAIEQMLRKHMGFSVQKENKKPREVIENATIYNLDMRVCIPPVAFKSAMLTASTQLKALKKTQLRTALFVEGASVPITYEECIPRMDMVRTSGMTRTPDVRFRPSFTGWKARMIIQFSDSLSVQTVVDLLQRAGTVGVGEWRPEKNGTFGTFRISRHIVDPKEVAMVRKECSVALVRPRIPDWALDANIDPTVLAKAFAEVNMEAAEEAVNG